MCFGYFIDFPNSWYCWEWIQNSTTESWERNDGNFSGHHSKANICCLLSQVFLSFTLKVENKLHSYMMYHCAVIFSWYWTFDGIYVLSLQKTAGSEAFCLIMLCSFDSPAVFIILRNIAGDIGQWPLYTLQSDTLLHGVLAT